MMENTYPLLAQVTAAHIRRREEPAQPLWVTNTLRITTGMEVEIDRFGLCRVYQVNPTSIYLDPHKGLPYGTVIPAGTPILIPE